MPEDNQNRTAVIISLGNLLSEVETNGQLYSFNTLDVHLFEFAGKVFLEVGEKMGIEP